jgi:hypothetical protein
VTYYEELGVETTASGGEIRRAFERLARPWRDENSRRISEAELERLGGIVDVLLDSRGREQYDRSLAALANALAGAPVLPMARSWKPRWIGLAAAGGAAILFLLLLLIPVPARTPEVRLPTTAQQEWEPVLTKSYVSHVPPNR